MNDTLSGLLCAASNDDKHFVKTPISLHCGHCVCQTCLSINNAQLINCVQCGTITNRDLRNDKESIPTKLLIKFCLSDLFNEIEKQTAESIDRLKCIEFEL